MAYARSSQRRKRGGGAGALVAPLLIVAVLGGLGWFAYNRIRRAREVREVPLLARAVVLGWQGGYGLKGQVPDKVPASWRFSFEMGPYYREKPDDQTMYPSAWVDVELEDGRFTGMLFAVYRRSLRTAPFAMLEEPEFAGPGEGEMLRSFIRELREMPSGSSIERQTPGFRLFAWKKKGKTALRGSMVCAVRKDGGPASAAMYGEAKAEWEALEK